VRDIVVLAAGKKQLKHHDTRMYFDQSLKLSPPINVSEICDRFKIPFIRIAHDDSGRIAEIVDHYKLEVAIISGARIIRGEVISLFSDGIINFHPGKIPETSGLDAFYYTVKNNVPAGVTTHYIDHRVDAGSEIYFDEAVVSAACTPEVLQENVYQLQRVALRRLVSQMQLGGLNSRTIFRPTKNEPMTPEKKLDALARFPAWRSARYVEQQHAGLMLACAEGQLEIATEILDKLPKLYHQRNEKGWTPLIAAAHHNRREVVKFLLQLGANPNDCGFKGTTVLMYAKTKLLNVQDADYGLLDDLLAGGADVARTDCFGKNVLDYVQESGDWQMIEYFSKKMRLINGVY
jgi:folate-dependent phosphoribosylglycinamide formyltransferase PurN